MKKEKSINLQDRQIQRLSGSGRLYLISGTLWISWKGGKEQILQSGDCMDLKGKLPVIQSLDGESKAIQFLSN